MRFKSGSFTPNREVDEIRWVTLDEAQRLLTHKHDVEVLDRFVRGPSLTGCVLLVRHASAGSRAAWDGPDRKRPLDAVGVEQSEHLVRLLSRFEVQRIFSADVDRCVQTVQPLAQALGLPVEETGLVSEGGYPGREAEALKRLRSFGDLPDATVVCSQGDAIPSILRKLAEGDHVDLPQGISSKKGSVWALNFEGSRLFTAEHFPPPAPGGA